MTALASWHLDSPNVRSGAISLVSIKGDCEGALDCLGVRRVDIGGVGLREIPGIDQCVIARWATDQMHVMPHGGGAVRSLLAARLASIGLLEREPGGDQPEVAALRLDRARFDAVLMRDLARADSPLAIDLMLDQWRRIEAGLGEVESEHALSLSRLIEPPLVVACGLPNIGKSTLANVLAGREVSLVADQPGTTRDHVGFLLNLGGLVVRYVDAPGVASEGWGAHPKDPFEAAAIRLIGPLLARADLVLWCTDARANGDDSDALAACLARSQVRAPVKRVRLRGDLVSEGAAMRGSSLHAHEPMLVSARTDEGMERLIMSIQDALVGGDALESQGVWPFWRLPA